MKRSYLPKIDRLEDRCVPAADLLDGAAPPPADSPPPGDTDVVTDSPDAPADDGTSYVIDPYLIDPNAPPPPTKTTDPIPDGGWTNPDETPVPPIDDPFWH